MHQSFVDLRKRAEKGAAARATYGSLRIGWKLMAIGIISSHAVRLFAILAITALGATHAVAQVSIFYKQQGPRLDGISNGTTPSQGSAVAISADGNTIVSGTPDDTNPTTGAIVGGAFVFTRDQGVWTQQGPKLLGSGAPGDARQGSSVAISDDGNTIAIGGPYDDATTGAVWIFVRQGGAWTQQGPKLVGAGSQLAHQGSSVALSADGDTLVVGGPFEGGQAGAVWTFSRTNGTWAQSGPKLTTSFQNTGRWIALSSDGTKLLVGEMFFVRSNGVWVSSSGISGGNQVVSLSRDGTTALIDAEPPTAWSYSGLSWVSQGQLALGSNPPLCRSHALSANGNIAVLACSSGGLVFVRSNGSWTRQGDALTGSPPSSMSAVAMSADGQTVALGTQFSPGIFVYVASTPPKTATHDFNASRRSDILWRHSNNFTVSMWFEIGQFTASSSTIGPVQSGWSIVGQRDFNGDAKHDILWRHDNGDLAVWYMDGSRIAQSASLGNISSTWSAVGTSDHSADDIGDILWRDTFGNVAMWLMSATGGASAAVGLGNVPTEWKIAAVADFDGDSKADILWRDDDGNLAIWFVDGGQVTSSVALGFVGAPWSIVATGDLNGDGNADILWRDNVGNSAAWFMSGGTITSAAALPNLAPTWSVIDTGDYDGDGKSDILWRDVNGDIRIWYMNDATVRQSSNIGNAPNLWVIQNKNLN